MELPVGEIIEKNLLLKEIDVKQKIPSLLESQFFGYCVLTIGGRSGIEEGVIFFQGDKIIGAVFEYLRFSKKVFGDSALLHFLNASRADFGVMDIVNLTRQQIELIMAFNEKIELSKPVFSKDLLKIIPLQYNPQFAESVLGEELSKKESRFDVFKKIGLAEFSNRFE